MSDTVPSPKPLLQTDSPDPQAVQAAVANLEQKTDGFITQALSKDGEPSSKRVIAFIVVLVGIIIGAVFSSFAIATVVTPILNSVDVSKMPIISAAIEFIKYFITACFVLGGAALGITGLEAFSKKFGA